MVFNLFILFYLDSRSLFKFKIIKQLFKLVHKQKLPEIIEIIFINRARNLVDFNTKNNYGETILHLAAKGENEEIVKICLKIGIDPFQKNRKGKIAMELAKKQTIRDLLKQGNNKEYVNIEVSYTYIIL